MDSNFQYAGAVNLIVALLVFRLAALGFAERVNSPPDSLLEGSGFEPLVPRLCEPI
jgi:hypothetical protein